MNGPTRFGLGSLYLTPGALLAVADCPEQVPDCLSRHVRCDWGDLCVEDRRVNEDALRKGARLLSAYKLPDGTVLWVITDPDRAATTVLMPEEY